MSRHWFIYFKNCDYKYHKNNMRKNVYIYGICKQIFPTYQYQKQIVIKIRFFERKFIYWNQKFTNSINYLNELKVHKWNRQWKCNSFVINLLEQDDSGNLWKTS